MKHAPELSTLFAAERAVRPPPGAIEHGLARLLPAVAANVAPLPVAVGALKLTWTAFSKWILAGFVVGVVGSGAAARVSTPAATRAEAATQAPSRVAAPAELAASPTATSPAREPIPSPSSMTTQAPAAASRLSPALASSSEPTRFDAELRLLTLAKSELDAGRPHLAQAWLSEHAARFPQGVFTTDRQALSALISCGARPDAAVARRFAAAHPRSPMLERLLRTCGVSSGPRSLNEKPGDPEPTHEEGEK